MFKQQQTDEETPDLSPSPGPVRSGVRFWSAWRGEWLLAFCTLVIFLGCVSSPPSLMDDVDSVTAQIARNMIESGDWVTARLNGIAYFEKPAMRFWIVAVSYLVFGVHDWAARIPLALAAIALCWVTRAIGVWAFSRSAGNLAGIVLATCVGLFLFTRILIPDVALTLAITITIWSLVRAVEEDEPHPIRWATWMAVGLGAGFLLKGLIALVFPAGVGFLYLLLTRQLGRRRTWERLRPVSTLAILAVMVLPWLVLATIRNPPYFDFTMTAKPGQYHGFFWFFFLNEHLFRYLNRRYPHDYNTVPRAAFWLYHLLWLFPWSVYFPAVPRTRFFGSDRASRIRLLCLCWIGVVLGFFTFSTTQEYYSMPCYPAFALLLGSAMASVGESDRRIHWGSRVAALLSLASAVACGWLLWRDRALATPDDISDALQHQVSTLSLGHTQELTIQAFAYLRLPLALAGGAFLLGAIGAWFGRRKVAWAALAIMMVLVCHAARLALITFSPYLGSRPLAEALNASPPGTLIVDDQYYTFSSIFFYTDRRALLLNGRVMNLEYGSYAPGAPDVFLNDQGFAARWNNNSERLYLAADGSALPRLRALVGAPALHIVRAAGGKFLLTNQPLPASKSLAAFEANLKP